MWFITKKHLITVSIVALLAVSTPALAWGNGGYSESPDNPDYGTHDWIAEHALDYLYGSQKEYIENNLNLYLYGTELPDNNQADDGIGDTWYHHVYYYADGSIQDDIGAQRAHEEYLQLISYIQDEDYKNASKTAGIMTHYIADVGVFGHVMGADTDWGEETHHSDYEGYIGRRTDQYYSEFDSYLVSDGLEKIDAYQATVDNAYITTFGDGSTSKSCEWMDANYDWSNTAFEKSAGEALNRCVNLVADVLYSAYQEATPINMHMQSSATSIFSENNNLPSLLMGDLTLSLDTTGVHSITFKDGNHQLGKYYDTDQDGKFTLYWHPKLSDLGFHSLNIEGYNQYNTLVVKEKIRVFVFPQVKKDKQIHTSTNSASVQSGVSVHCCSTCSITH